jgi:phosphatidylethanolamine/phosphatidyl-N-methylethanolamine N-methyltransferase
MRDAPTYESDYIQNYDNSNTDRTLAGSFLQKSHSLLENSRPPLSAGHTVLEVGAGSGHHFPFVRKEYSKYVMTDASLSMIAIAEKKHAEDVASGLLLVRQQNATSLDYPDGSFDRLIATHVLEHLTDPVSVLREWNRVVRPGGLISLVLPCDPGMLWRFGRHLGPRRNARKLGLAYDYLQAAEHVNSIFNLVVFIRHHFDQLIENWYPAIVPVPDLNLFYICHITTSKNGAANA